MKTITLLTAALVLLSTSCTDNKQEETKTTIADVVLSGTIENAKKESFSIRMNDGSETITVNINEDNSFATTLSLSEAGYVNYYIDRNSASIYALPGDSIHFSVNAEEFAETLNYTGDRAAENTFLAKRAAFKRAQADELGTKELYSQSYADFIVTIEARKDAEDAFIAKNSADLDADFLKFENKKTDLNQLVSKSMYKGYYSYFNDNKEAEDAPETAALFADLDLNDPSLTHFDGFNQLVYTALENQEPAFTYEELGDQGYFQELLARASKLENQKVREKTFYLALNDMISFGGGLDGVTTQVDDFYALNSNPTYQENIEMLVAEWEPLKKGNPAPEFIANHLDDSDFASPELKGKNIYVDVWATWCGPCKAEIPSLKKVEEEYEGKNIEFLSVSIDEEKDKDKWKTFVRDKTLGGTQVHAPDAWESEIAQKYLINGIPRFMIIDTEGNIVSANAPRPSDKRLKEMFDELLAS